MSASIETRVLPPLVDAKEFLGQDFKRIKVGLLAEEPSLDLLRWAITLKDESGFVYQQPDWFVIKASEFGVPVFSMPRDSDILMHSHPNLDGDKYLYLPSTYDFRNASDIAANLIVSADGITQFWPVNYEQKKILEYITNNARFIRIDTYKKFLGENGIRYEVYSWEDIGSARLTEIFLT